jgi:GrpB-like predicted nucleotidyltransferase (UPF0157 family)/GNAT superfamily N-acetyltransferase
MSTPHISRARSAGFTTNPAFRALLTAASDATGADLEALLDEIKDRDLLVVLDSAGEPSALAVYRRINAFTVEIQYLAVAPQVRHHGVATALVRRIQENEAAMVLARTDDDAIGFYRATGFQISDSPSDPRWPARRRYLCVLPHLPLLRHPITDDGPVEWIHGEPAPAPVLVHPPSASWPQDFAALAERIGTALGPGALAIEHLGSTSVPGLPAKPVIDVVLSVADPESEADYVDALIAAGFIFRLRESGWYGHRLFVAGPGEQAANIHIFAIGSPETSRMRLFRDWLTTHETDREAYARIKLASAALINESGGGMGLVMDYNRDKEPFIRELYQRILRNDSSEA